MVHIRGHSAQALDRRFAVFPGGQIAQGVLQGFTPSNTLGALVFTAGSFARTNTLLRFGGCLNATIGGFGYVCNIFASLVMVVQCFFTIEDTLGSFGLYVTAKTTLSFGFLVTFFKVSFLSSCRALLMAAFTMFLLYFRDNNINFNSTILCINVSLSLTILTNLKASENGMFLKMCPG